MIFIAIFNFIKKYWFIFALVIVYFVIAGMNILPRSLNVFKKKKILIDETPVVVKEIRAIGELVTAEFYGEVYADLNEFYENLVLTQRDSIYLNPAKYYQKYPGLKDYIAQAQSYRAEELTFEKEKENYNLYLNEYFKKLEAYRQLEIKLKKDLVAAQNENERKKLERRLRDLRDKVLNEKEIYKSRKEKFDKSEQDFSDLKESFRKERKKRNLVYIGRGWVKAGINLQNLTEKEVFIDDADSLYIHLLLPEPEIIDADINPWFIYTDKKKIKGFELFIAKTGSALAKDNFSDDEITAVKHICKERLKKNALEKGILKNAQSSAATTLENFFHLLGFDKVKINFKTEDMEIVQLERDAS